jgi:hypothetical protein
MNYPEQDVVAVSLVMQEQGVQLVGYGNDHMKVINRQQVCFPIIKPSLTLNTSTLWTMAVPATVIYDLFMATMLAMFHSASHGFSPASLQCMQCAQQMTGQRVLLLQIRQEVVDNSCDFGLGGLHQDKGS